VARRNRVFCLSLLDHTIASELMIRDSFFIFLGIWRRRGLLEQFS